MPIQLTSIFKAVNDIKTNLFYDTTDESFGKLVLKNLDTVLYTVEEGGFYVSKGTLDKLKGQEDVPGDSERRICKVTVINNTDLESALKLANSLIYGGRLFKIKQTIPPLADSFSNTYRLLLESFSEV